MGAVVITDNVDLPSPPAVGFHQALHEPQELLVGMAFFAMAHYLSLVDVQGCQQGGGSQAFVLKGNVFHFTVGLSREDRLGAV